MVEGKISADAQLVTAVAGGSMQALGELVCRHQDKVLSLAYRMLGRWDLAEDISQEAFLRVYQAARQYEPRAAFTTWLYRIVVNICLDARRRAKRQPIPLPDRALAVAARVEAFDPLEERERAEKVRHAIEDLPERQRTVLILHRYEDLSHRQIAEVTQWSEPAVESLLVRAYAHLREAVSELGQD